MYHIQATASSDTDPLVLLDMQKGGKETVLGFNQGNASTVLGIFLPEACILRIRFRRLAMSQYKFSLNRS